MSCLIVIPFFVVIILLWKWWHVFVGDKRRDEFYKKIYAEYETLDSDQLQQKQIWFLLDVENKDDFSVFFKVLLFVEMGLFVPELGRLFYQTDVEYLLTSIECLKMIIMFPFGDRVIFVLLTALIVWLYKQKILLENGLRSKIIDRILDEKMKNKNIR